MSTVAFATFCWEGDKKKMNDNLDAIVASHGYNFDRIYTVYQRTDIPYTPFIRSRYNLPIRREDYDRILKRFKIPINDPRADEITHGHYNPHYWKNHVINHLAVLDIADEDYIVFSDSDCIMVKNEPHSWVEEGIGILKQDGPTYVVSPSDGLPGKTHIMSQQLFLIDREDMLHTDFNCWDGKFREGGPMQEYYVMLEGRLGMFMEKMGMHRLVLPDNWRYWHGPDEHPVPDEHKDAVKGWK